MRKETLYIKQNGETESVDVTVDIGIQEVIIAVSEATDIEPYDLGYRSTEALGELFNTAELATVISRWLNHRNHLVLYFFQRHIDWPRVERE